MRWATLLLVLLLTPQATAVRVDAAPEIPAVDLCDCVGDPALAIGTARLERTREVAVLPPCVGDVQVAVYYLKIDAIRFAYAGAECHFDAWWYFDCEQTAEGDLACADESSWLTLAADGRFVYETLEPGYRLSGQLTRAT